MVFLEATNTDPYFNLALEEYVFEHMDRKKEYFMLWQNYNTIVVGKYQNTAEEINQQFVDEHSIKVVRRLSGGGAVYHDKGNLNFTFIVNQAPDAEFNFKVFVVPVVRALKKLGVKAEFNGRNDITINGQKFSGNSQYMRHGRLLHHGCIMLDSNLTTVADALKVKDAKFNSKSVKSVRSRVTTINANAPRHISMDEFKNTLRECALENGEMEVYTLTEQDIAAVNRLRDEKYATWEWNYGRSPEYDLRVERKFDAGLVAIHLQAESGRIKQIHFSGDFFGNGEISELENAMISLRLDKHLEQNLDPLNVGYYINGVSAQDIANMLLR